MKTKTSAVMLKTFPPDLTLKETRNFLNEIKNAVKVERPHLVLDCTHIREVNDSMVYQLLCCLEVAIKHNGDVKLAAVPAGVSKALITTGVSRLFEVFPTTAEAVASFYRFSATPEPIAPSALLEAEGVA